MTGTPADWYPDPLGRFAQRYFDGSAWTERVADEGGARNTDPVGSESVHTSPYPGTATRTIRLNALPFGKLISPSVFSAPERTWIDTEVARISANSDLWVPALMAHAEAHRILTLDIGKIARGSVAPFGIRRGFPLQALFLARWSVFETLWRFYLAPGNKPQLAAQLASHPYEAEVLRNSKYFGAAISGIQVEFQQAISQPPLGEDAKSCPFCAETIKAKAIVCRYCGRDLPADMP